MTQTPKDWEEKVRSDYKDILSEIAIEETIEYWRDIVKSIEQSAEERGRAKNYLETFAQLDKTGLVKLAKAEERSELRKWAEEHWNHTINGVDTEGKQHKMRLIELDFLLDHLEANKE